MGELVIGNKIGWVLHIPPSVPSRTAVQLVAERIKGNGVFYLNVPDLIREKKLTVVGLEGSLELLRAVQAAIAKDKPADTQMLVIDGLIHSQTEINHLGGFMEDLGFISKGVLFVDAPEVRLEAHIRECLEREKRAAERAGHGVNHPYGDARTQQIRLLKFCLLRERLKKTLPHQCRPLSEPDFTADGIARGIVVALHLTGCFIERQVA